MARGPGRVSACPGQNEEAPVAGLWAQEEVVQPRSEIKAPRPPGGQEAGPDPGVLAGHGAADVTRAPAGVHVCPCGQRRQPSHVIAVDGVGPWHRARAAQGTGGTGPRGLAAL